MPPIRPVLVLAEQVRAVLGDIDGLLAAVEVASTSPAPWHGGSTSLKLSVNASDGTSTNVISRPVARQHGAALMWPLA
jgi:hypothetical protein